MNQMERVQNAFSRTEWRITRNVDNSNSVTYIHTYVRTYVHTLNHSDICIETPFLPKVLLEYMDQNAWRMFGQLSRNCTPGLVKYIPSAFSIKRYMQRTYVHRCFQPFLFEAFYIVSIRRRSKVLSTIYINYTACFSLPSQMSLLFLKAKSCEQKLFSMEGVVT